MKPIVITCFAFLLFHSGFSQLRLPAVIASNMVLQQNDSVMLWGWGDAGGKVFVTNSWSGGMDSTMVSNGGKWKLKIKTPAAGGPYTLSFKHDWSNIQLQNILIGEVWFCSGQSNMDWSYYAGVNDMQQELNLHQQNKLRLFLMPQVTADYPQDDVAAQWAVCDSNNLKSFSAVAYFFAKKLQDSLKVPVGLIQASWGGTPAEVWMPEAAVNNNPILKKANEQLGTYKWWPKIPGATFNAMVAPVTSFNIAGAIWYQGEGNTGAAATYGSLLTTLIDSWRAAWEKNIPFYYVQIAPYTYGKNFIGAQVREQQTLASKHKNTGMVAIPDLVEDTTNIHPKNKKDVGFRLGNMALAYTYHYNSVVVQYPAYDGLQISDKKAIISFTNTNGALLAKGKSIAALEVAGEDRVFYPAEGKINGNVLTVTSKNVKKPIAVRYGFSNAGIGNLFSSAGLPVIPFRTDDWPLQ